MKNIKYFTSLTKVYNTNIQKYCFRRSHSLNYNLISVEIAGIDALDYYCHFSGSFAPSGPAPMSHFPSVLQQKAAESGPKEPHDW